MTRPPQEHIDRALRVEESVKPHERDSYLKIMNNLPMSQRTRNQELRDGCILTGIFESAHRGGHYMS